MKSQLTQDFVFDMRIGYYKDLSYYDRASSCDGGEYQILNSTSYNEEYSADNIFSLVDDQWQYGPAN